MLRPVALSQQWRQIEAGLGHDWGEARLALAVPHLAEASRAAALLAPLMPGRRGNRIVVTVHRGGSPSEGALTRALARIDEAGISGTLRLLDSAVTPVETPAPRPSLAAAWAGELEGLPADWSDLHGELELTSSDHLERAALLVAPLNPTRVRETPAFRFRAARRFGYGAAPEMVKRTLERLDGEDIRGELRILRVLSDTKPVYTQGPVWYVGGRAV
jgi:hypothetical protein